MKNFPGMKLPAVAGIASAVLLAAPVGIPLVVTNLGFTSSGIVGGSWAAGFMASYGGTIPAGSACAVMQSIGALGTFAGAGIAGMLGTAMAAAGAAGAVFQSAANRQGGAPATDDSSSTEDEEEKKEETEPESTSVNEENFDQ